VFVGFDQPKSLGDEEQGASAALPIFVDFMTAALKDQPATPFRVPSGVRLVRVDAATGALPGPGTEAAILEAYMPGTEPTNGRAALRITPLENGAAPMPESLPRRGVPQTGGLY
jgi:penicillin-binding protein 1A